MLKYPAIIALRQLYWAIIRTSSTVKPAITGLITHTDPQFTAVKPTTLSVKFPEA